MNGPGPLGAFLQARRARLRPEDVGLRDLGPRRRVAGLRREELAQLAGVSVSYYARLEQGLSRGASAEVLDAIARALLLDDHERGHLDRLAGAARHAPRVRRPRPEKLADETRDLLRAVDGVPAIVLGRRTDVLAWNSLGHALLAGHLDLLGPDDPARRPNMSRMLFLDLHCQELYADWKRKARAVVGNLRIAVGRHPEDPLLAELIGELTMKSPEFVALWGGPPCGAVRCRVLRAAPSRRRHGDGDTADTVDRPFTGTVAHRVHNPRQLLIRGGPRAPPAGERQPGAARGRRRVPRS
ncbi:transcriptional regulator, XRE family [Streptomyces sp. Ncost-T10-10d]|nr:transcriptional regulator, XRE family [Streptomyces sp. Ncost-T10-10d]